MGNVAVCRSLSEEGLLTLQCFFQAFTAGDILLTPVDDPDEAEFQRIDTAGENFQSICAVVHKVELREHSDCPFSGRIHLTC